MPLQSTFVEPADPRMENAKDPYWAEEPAQGLTSTATVVGTSSIHVLPGLRATE